MNIKTDFLDLKFDHPRISFSPVELQNLKNEWNEKKGQRYEFLKLKKEELLKLIDLEIYFPPEGSNHNQWYQCDNCQFGLKTIGDDDHLCEKCNTTYHGQPYVGVVYRSKHIMNLTNMYLSSILFHLDGNQKYLNFAKSILIGYADRYLRYEYHDNANKTGSECSPTGGRLFPQTLDESVQLSQLIAPALDLLYNDLVSQDIKHIQESLIKPMLAYISARKAGISNWQSYHNNGMLYGGYVLEDAEIMNASLNDPENGFIFQLDKSINMDGMWYENSWSYHDYALQALTHYLNGCSRLGLSIHNHPKVELMYEAPLNFVLSNYDLPRIGDGLFANLKDPAAFYSSASLLFPDNEKILSLIPKKICLENLHVSTLGKSFNPIMPQNSTIMKSAGMAVLRNDSNDKKIGVSVNFGEYGGFHGHFDKLSFTLHGYDEELGVDPGRSESQAYRLPIHSEWYKSTFSHNTIMIDSKDQEGVAGELVAFAEEGEFSYLISECDSMYSGAHIKRTCIVNGNYLVVFDKIECDSIKDIDWIYHNHGQEIQSNAIEKADLSRIVGAKYVEEIAKSKSSYMGQLKFCGQNIDVQLHYSSNQECILYTGKGLYRSTAHRVPMCLLSFHEKSISVMCVIEPLKNKERSSIKDVSFEEIKDGYVLYIKSKTSEEKYLMKDNVISYSYSI